MNDKKAKNILEEMYEYMGQGIGSLINIFDPEIVVINGGFIEAGFFQQVIARMRGSLPRNSAPVNVAIS